jgi:hypothetical protein
MRSFLLLIALCVTVYPAPDTLRQSMGDEQEEPAYKVFYENGFYTAAIELLQSRIRERPDTVNVEYLTYLAFCYTATGRQDSARRIFLKILDRDSTFYLDTIAISPKIVSVFDSARSIRGMRHAAEVVDAPSVSIPALTPADTVPPGAAPDGAAPGLTAHLPSAHWIRFGIACVPGGVGQFQDRHPFRGVLLLSLQALGCGVGFWAYYTRKDHYDPSYGWWERNRNNYQNHTNLSIAGFTLFISAYAISTADGVIFNWKNRRK